VSLRAPWRPMAAVAAAQMLIAFGFNALVVSIGGIVETFEIPATSVGTAIVLSSFWPPFRRPDWLTGVPMSPSLRIN